MIFLIIIIISITCIILKIIIGIITTIIRGWTSRSFGSGTLSYLRRASDLYWSSCWFSCWDWHWHLYWFLRSMFFHGWPNLTFSVTNGDIDNDIDVDIDIYIYIRNIMILAMTLILWYRFLQMCMFCHGCPSSTSSATRTSGFSSPTEAFSGIWAGSVAST